MRAVMEKAASGKAGGSTVPVKYTSRIREIGEGAFIRWSAEICAYLPAGALVNAASTRLRSSAGQSAPEASNNSSKVTGAGGESGKENGGNNILLIIDANENLRNAIRNQA